MTRVFVALVLSALLAVTANAGTISGKVSGVSGESVVYVDTIAGKTFPVPSAHPVMDQKGLLSAAHLGCSSGRNGRFCEQRQGRSQRVLACIPAGRKETAGKEPGHVADGREALFQV